MFKNGMHVQALQRYTMAASIAVQRPPNLAILVQDNARYGETGMQETPTAHGTDLLAIARGAGYDVIGYAPSLGHLYLAGTACRCLVVLGVSASGSLSFLGRFDATSSAHCASASIGAVIYGIPNRRSMI